MTTIGRDLILKAFGYDPKNTETSARVLADGVYDRLLSLTLRVQRVVPICACGYPVLEEYQSSLVTSIRELFLNGETWDIHKMVILACIAMSKRILMCDDETHWAYGAYWDTLSDYDTNRLMFEAAKELGFDGWLSQNGAGNNNLYHHLITASRLESFNPDKSCFTFTIKDNVLTLAGNDKLYIKQDDDSWLFLRIPNSEELEAINIIKLAFEADK